jgi:protein-histidine pros-kinase
VCAKSVVELLANAVKFTDEGGSTDVTARAVDDDRLEIRVRDTGIGIREEDAPSPASAE